MTTENEKFNIDWDAKEILRVAKSEAVEVLISEVRKPLGTTDYKVFFDALESYCTLRNAQKALWRF